VVWLKPPLDLLSPLMGGSNVLMKSHKAFRAATEVRGKNWYPQENLTTLRNNLIN
jgi:hypothetical protein